MQSNRNQLSFVLMVLGCTLFAAELLAAGHRDLAHASGQAASAQAGSGAKSDGDPLAKAYRFESGGWIYVHLEGSPHDVGYQHGYLLGPEIADAYAALSLQMTHTTQRDWDFFRRAAREMLWPKIDPEYQAELQGNCRRPRSPQSETRPLRHRRDERLRRASRLLRSVA